jgi:hypothetical protein
MLQKIKNQQHGTILLVFLITLPFLITVSLYYMSLSLTSFQVAHFDQLHTEAQLAADAGADASMEAFSADNSWSSSGGELTIHNDGNIRTTYTSSVSGDDTSKTIAVTGKAYRPASATTPSRSVKINVDLRPVKQGNYSIVAGAGGLVMKNSAKILGGSVFVNGSITMTGSSSIGLLIFTVPVNVADQICPVPADSTYPAVCSNNSHPPINISNPAHIYGKVTATNQTDGSRMSLPGLVSGSVAPQALPTYDRAAQKASVANTMSGAAASCTNLLGGSVTWPANTKIIGNVTVSNLCHATIKGNVWITGTLTVSNSAQLIVDSSVGTTRPVVMVDGSTGVSFNNSALVISNLQGTGAEFITYYCGAGCDEDSTVTGTALAASQSLPTINLNNSAAASDSIFYAYWSQINLNNTGQIGAVVGQNIVMTNTAAITFGTSTGIGTTVWVLKGYRRQL